MTESRVLRSAVAALAAAAVLTAAACGGSEGGSGGGADQSAGDSTGVTATSVKIGSHYPLTGRAAPGYSKIGPAAKAFFDYVNDNGGVNGRKIDFVYRDDAYNPAQTVQVVRQLVLQDKVFALVGGLGTPTHTKVVDWLNQSKVPDLFVASGCQCWDQPDKHPYTYGWQPDYYREGKILGKYLAEKFAGKKIAYFFQNDDFGKDGVRGLDQFIDKNQVVTRQAYQPGNTDIGPQLTAIAQAKADVVVSFTIPAYSALLKLGTLKLGIAPQLVISNVGSDPVTLSGLLEAFAKQGGSEVKGSQLIEGIISDAYLPAYLGPEAASNSWVALFKKVHEKYLAKTVFDGNTEYGMAQAYTFVQVLQRAGKNPTRESLLKALDAGGLTGPTTTPFGFSADSHSGVTGVQIVKITKGVPVPDGPPSTTDAATGAVTPFTGTPVEAPANGIPPV
ncbi:MAG TPA: ABC transporter substrate-binding protein [Kineosporiaceae bacterium]|nr:ABC transporter substrate-binding protein [Kineosporiaceae bacterium]